MRIITVQRFLRSLRVSGRLRHQTAGSGTKRLVPEPAQPAQAQTPTGLDRLNRHIPATAGWDRPRPAQTLKNYFYISIYNNNDFFFIKQ